MTSSAAGTTWKNLRTGILFVFGLALIATLGLIINGNTGVLSSHRSARFVVNDIRGLAAGNPVQIAGMKVGSVGDMHFTQADGRTGVEVVLSIQSEHFPMITSDSRAVVKQVGMLGDKIVEIELGTSRAPLADGGMLAVQSEAGLSEAMASGIETLGTVGEISRKVGGLLQRIDDGEGSLGQLITSTDLVEELTNTVVDLRRVTSRMAEGNGMVWRAFEDRATAEEFSRTVASLSAMSAELRSVAQSISRGEGTLGRFVKDDSLYRDLRGVAQHSDSMIARLEEPIKSFSSNSQIYANLNRSIQSLDSLLNDMKARPGRYVRFSVFQ